MSNLPQPTNHAAEITASIVLKLASASTSKCPTPMTSLSSAFINPNEYHISISKRINTTQSSPQLPQSPLACKRRRKTSTSRFRDLNVLLSESFVPPNREIFSNDFLVMKHLDEASLKSFLSKRTQPKRGAKRDDDPDDDDSADDAIPEAKPTTTLKWKSINLPFVEVEEPMPSLQQLTTFINDLIFTSLDSQLSKPEEPNEQLDLFSELLLNEPECADQFSKSNPFFTIIGHSNTKRRNENYRLECFHCRCYFDVEQDAAFVLHMRQHALQHFRCSDHCPATFTDYQEYEMHLIERQFWLSEAATKKIVNFELFARNWSILYTALSKQQLLLDQTIFNDPLPEFCRVCNFLYKPSARMVLLPEFLNISSLVSLLNHTCFHFAYFRYLCIPCSMANGLLEHLREFKFLDKPLNATLLRKCFIAFPFAPFIIEHQKAYKCIDVHFPSDAIVLHRFLTVDFLDEIYSSMLHNSAFDVRQELECYSKEEIAQIRQEQMPSEIQLDGIRSLEWRSQEELDEDKSAPKDEVINLAVVVKETIYNH